MSGTLDLRSDSDTMLILFLLLVLIQENADQKLILALLYILLV